MKVYRYSEIFVSTILPAFFEGSVLKSPYFMRYLRSNITKFPK